MISLGSSTPLIFAVLFGIFAIPISILIFIVKARIARRGSLNLRLNSSRFLYGNVVSGLVEVHSNFTYTGKELQVWLVGIDTTQKRNHSKNHIVFSKSFTVSKNISFEAGQRKNISFKINLPSVAPERAIEKFASKLKIRFFFDKYLNLLSRFMKTNITWRVEAVLVVEGDLDLRAIKTIIVK